MYEKLVRVNIVLALFCINRVTYSPITTGIAAIGGLGPATLNEGAGLDGEFTRGHSFGDCLGSWRDVLGDRVESTFPRTASGTPRWDLDDRGRGRFESGLLVAELGR